MKRKITFFSALVLGAGFVIANLSALQAFGATSNPVPSNFQLAPPPLPYPTFKLGRQDYNFAGTYLKASTSDFSLFGLGLDMKMRGVPAPRVAFDMEMPLFMATGNLGTNYANQLLSQAQSGYTFSTATATMMMENFAPAFGLEVLAIDSEFVSGIIFGGFNFNMFFGSLTGSATIPTGTKLGSVAVTMSGSALFYTTAMPLGAQLGIKLGPHLLLAPFFTYTQGFGGSSTVDITGTATILGYTASASTSTTYKIPGFTSTRYGADLVFPALHMSLGSLFQSTAPSIPQEKSMNIFMLHLSWHWSKETAVAETEKQAAPENVHESLIKPEIKPEPPKAEPKVEPKPEPKVKPSKVEDEADTTDTTDANGNADSVDKAFSKKVHTPSSDEE